MLSKGGQRLDVAARWCRQCSKPECVSLFPIRGLSLSSRHWQHREKKKNSPSGIHLPSLFCLRTLETSFPPLHTHIHTHISKHILLSWLHADGQHELMDTNEDVKTKQHIPGWANIRKYTKTKINTTRRLILTRTQAQTHNACLPSCWECILIH